MSRKKFQKISKFIFAVTVVGFGFGALAVDHDGRKSDREVSNTSACEPLLAPEVSATVASTKNAIGTKRAPKAKSARGPRVQSGDSGLTRHESAGVFPLRSLLLLSDENPAVKHPFILANAGEKLAAVVGHFKPRRALDPVYGVNPIWVYPGFAGESPLSEGHMVVGQEGPIHKVVSDWLSRARGDNSGKAVGLAGNPGTGKTALVYSVKKTESNLDRVDPKFEQFSYRFVGLHKIPFLKGLFTFVNGEPMNNFFDPDMPRSPFTLLRKDMQDRLLADLPGRIDRSSGIKISKGWTLQEPKTVEILKAIFEYEYPAIGFGKMTIDDLSEDQYLDTIEKYVVTVPRRTIRPIYNDEAPPMIRAQTDDPNWGALFSTVNMRRAAIYGENHPLAIDYLGQVFQLDGGLLAYDEFYRNPPALLNVNLDVIQNQVVQTDIGRAVKLDVVTVWNANDESIQQARQESALNAMIDRSSKYAMRSLLHPNQIEAVMPFQIGIAQYKMRWLDSNIIVPMDYSAVYPTVSTQGKTETAAGRVALYYSGDRRDILFAPYALNYMAWLASSTRFVTDAARLKEYEHELNLVSRDPGVFTSAITRLKIVLGEKTVAPAVRAELARVVDLMREGENGISARDIETWLKEVFTYAIENGRDVITPKMVDDVFGRLLDGGTIDPKKLENRQVWQQLRGQVKLELLLPALERDVRTIISGDGSRAERTYDQIERELIEMADRPDATEVHPDDGSGRIPINFERLKAVKEIYRELYRREFSSNFLLQNLRDARLGKGERNSELLEAVRVFVSRTESLTADYISAFSSHYQGEPVDAGTLERVSLVETGLSHYGYNLSGFKEALQFVESMRREKMGAGNR